MKVKIKDIAARAGVSTGTVDRVIHSRGRVSHKTRELVEKAMHELEYKPDIVARMLARRDQRLIKILLPYPYQDAYWKIVRDGIEEGLREFSPYRIQGQIHYYDMNDSIHFHQIGSEMLEHRPDIVLLGSEYHHQTLDLVRICHQQDIPCIILNAEINSIPRLSFIGINSYAVGELVGRIIRNTRGLHHVLVVHNTENIENTPHLKNKEIGLRSSLAEAGPNFRVEDIVIRNEASRNQTMAAISKAISDHEADTVYFSTSRAYQFSVALKKKFPGLYIIGHDLIDQHIRLMEKGAIDLLIDQSGYRMGYLSIRSWVHHLIMDQEIPSTQYLPIKIIYPENLPFFHLPRTLEEFPSSTMI